MKKYIRSLVLIGVAMTEYHRLGDFNDRHVFLTALEARKPKVKVPADSVSGENPLPSLRQPPSPVCSRGLSLVLAHERKVLLSISLLNRPLIPS